MLNQLFHRHGRKGKAILYAGITSLVVTGGFALWRQVDTTLESFELYSRDRLFNLLIHLRGEPSPDPRFLIVGITEQDIQAHGENGSITDEKIAQLLMTLTETNPQAIGLDIYRDVPIGTGQDRLMWILQQQPDIFVVCKVGTDLQESVLPPPGITKSQIGVADLPPDGGDIIRRGLLAIDSPDLPISDSRQNPCQDPTEPLFSLGFQLARRYLENSGIPMKITARDEIQFGNVTIPPLTPTAGGYLQADTAGYQILLEFPQGPKGPEQVTLSEVLNQQVSQALIRDRIILIGYVAESKKDVFSTPFNSTNSKYLYMPGVVIHAQVASQVIGNVLDGRPLTWYLPEWAEIFWIWIWACFGGLIAGFIRHPFVNITGTLAMLVLCLGVTAISFNMGGWVLLATPILAYAITLTGVSLIDRYAQPLSRQIKEFLKIDIEIDRAEVEDTVQEIEESDTFQEIKQAGQRLRQKQQGRPTNTLDAGESGREANSENPNSLEKKVQEILSSSQSSDSQEITSSDSEETLNNPTDLDSYFNQIRDQGAHIKQQNNSEKGKEPDPNAD